MMFKSKIKRLIFFLSPFNPRTLCILRFEFGNLFQRFKNAVNPLYHFKLMRLTKMSGLKVNVGSGGNGREGWINIDARCTHRDIYIAYDIRRRLPFKNGQVQYLFAEHVIEHLDFRDDISEVFKEFHRILQPGGKLRIIVPDGERFIKAYASGDNLKWQGLGWDLKQLPGDIYTPMHVINHIFHQGGEHLFAYDFETLKFALTRDGFKEVRKTEYLSGTPDLCIDEPTQRAY